MPRKIHFINPATSQQACGVAIDSLRLRLTDDITQVTCQHCLNTASGKKHAGGKPRHGADPKVPITLKIDRELRDKAKAKKINCSRLLEQAIAKHK